MTTPSPVKPLAGVALLVAVPLDEGGFLVRVPHCQWLSKYWQPDLDPDARRRHLLELWQSRYAPEVAEPLRELVAAARQLGVDVFADATLSSLAACTVTFSVVIVFAHWKGPEITTDDLPLDWEWDDFTRKLDSSGDPFARQIKSMLAAGGPASATLLTRLLRRRGASVDRDATVTAKLARCLDLPLPAADGIDGTLESVAVRHAVNRDRLDRLLNPELQPGNRLEFYDGLWSKEAVYEAVHRAFTGTLDLTTCTSTYLSDHLTGASGRRFRTVQFPTVQKFSWAAIFLQLALKRWTATGGSYLEARDQARADLEAEVLTATKKRNIRV